MAINSDAFAKNGNILPDTVLLLFHCIHLLYMLADIADIVSSYPLHYANTTVWVVFSVIHMHMFLGLPTWY